jgi:hypothetical protein
MQKIFWSIAALVVLSVIGGPIFGILVVGSVIAYLIYKENEKRELQEQEQREAEAEREAEAKRQHLMAQERLRGSLEQYGQNALAAYAGIPAALLTAEELLDRAEHEYEDRAFTPFWEAVEGALHKLADSENLVQSISHIASSHADTAKAFEGPVEKFPVDVEAIRRLEVADNTQQRMRSIVRLAQKDFQFATIFEQRRTTSVLIAGFETLGQAIAGLGDRLVSSLDSLSDQVRNLEYGLQERHAEMLSSLGDVVEGIQRASADAAEQRDTIAARHAKAAEDQLAMLDNIQRRRKPFDSERGPRFY